MVNHSCVLVVMRLSRCGKGRVGAVETMRRAQRYLRCEFALELSRIGRVQAGMILHPFKSIPGLLVMLFPLAAVAAAPEEEAKFVDAAQKAFDGKKPAELSKMTCWDRVSDHAKSKQEEVYKALVNEKNVTFSVKLAEVDLKLVKGQKEESLRQNLKIIKKLDLRLIDSRDKRTLGIIGFPVGENDGKLLLTTEVVEK